MESIVEYVSKEDAKVHRRNKTVLVEQACNEIVEKEGTVTGELLLSVATDKEHPLHDCFEWNDGIAGDKFRKMQASAMIIATRYVCYLKQNNRKKKVQASLRKAVECVQVRRFLPMNDGTGFRDRKTILSDAENRQAVIERKLTALRSWCRSVVDISELSEIRATILEATS